MPRGPFRAQRASHKPPAKQPDLFAGGLFPVCVATHDLGIRRLFDLSTLLLLLDCRPGDLVLDLGAGSGFSTEMLARLGYDAVAVDPDLAALAHNRARPTYDRHRIEGSVKVIASRAERLPFFNNSFDGILGMNVLHHVPDVEQVVTELARVLKPGCRAVFVEPGLDHLQSTETQRAIRELGEDDKPFDVMRFLETARERGFKDAMLTATLQAPLRLLPIEEVELYVSGTHPRPHLTPRGVIDELHRRHAFAMLVREGARPKTSRHPGVLRHALVVDGVPRVCKRGARFRVTAQITNVGDTVWEHTPSPRGGFVTFGCKLITRDGTLVDDTIGRTFLPHAVEPGQSLSLPILITLPASMTGGEYNLCFDLVDELICWFTDVSGDAPVVCGLAITE